MKWIEVREWKFRNEKTHRNHNLILSQEGLVEQHKESFVNISAAGTTSWETASSPRWGPTTPPSGRWTWTSSAGSSRPSTRSPSWSSSADTSWSSTAVSTSSSTAGAASSSKLYSAISSQNNLLNIRYLLFLCWSAYGTNQYYYYAFPKKVNMK